MTTYTKLTEIKKDLLKAVKYEDDVTVFVKVYDCDESGEQTFDVEVMYYVDGEYQDCFVSDTFGDEKEVAVKRAKAVLKSVAKWFTYSEVEVITDVEVYTN
jgi:hypothetical protein